MASYTQWFEDFTVNQHIKLLGRWAHNPSRKKHSLESKCMALNLKEILLYKDRKVP